MCLNTYDGIIYFEHDKTWIEKITNKYFRDNKIESAIINSIEKVYIPFEEIRVNGDVHAFISEYGKYHDKPAFMHEIKENACFTAILPQKTKLNKYLLRHISPFDTKKIKPFSHEMIDCDIKTFDQYEVEEYEKAIINKKIEEVKSNILSNLLIKNLSDEELAKLFIEKDPVEDIFNEIAQNEYYFKSHSMCESLVNCSKDVIRTFLFPVWIINGKYDNSEFELYINDQTRKARSNIVDKGVRRQYLYEIESEKEAEKRLEKRRNISLIIGGLVLILAFLITAYLSKNESAGINSGIRFVILDIIVLPGIIFYFIGKVCNTLIPKYEYKLLEKSVKYKKNYSSNKKFESVKAEYVKKIKLF